LVYEEGPRNVQRRNLLKNFESAKYLNNIRKAKVTYYYPSQLKRDRDKYNRLAVCVGDF
jgi:hypothetical protein